VRRYARTTVSPGGVPRRLRVSLLDPFRDEVLRRWESGCQNGHQIYRELVALGYCGGRSVVSDVVAQLRRGLPTRLTNPPQPRTPRQLRWLLVRPAATLGVQDREHLARLTEEHARVRLLYELVQAFVALVHEHDLDGLELWVERAKRSGIAELCAFVQGIERDYPAVARALTLPFSQGPVEGQITRLKLLKRQMYGRGKLDLLEQRLLHPVYCLSDE
jgi:transposase